MRGLALKVANAIVAPESPRARGTFFNLKLSSSAP
jgi:hypothetical protein